MLFSKSVSHCLSSWRRLALLVALLGLVACTSSSGDPVTPLPETGAGAGGSGGGLVLDYPEGPYGTVVGQTLTNFTFPGYTRPAEGTGEEKRRDIAMADFFNPTGDGVYEEGSAYGAGSPRPKALMLNVSALWCAPCKEEAKYLLPEKYAELGPKGMELLVIIVDGNEQGVTGTFDDLELWISAFAVNYPAAIDPFGQLGAVFDPNSFPGNMIVDTRTMRIVEVIAGKPGDSFWLKSEDLL
jgi:hypothetical protein